MSEALPDREHARPSVLGVALSPLARAIVFAVAWLPAVIVTVCWVPWFGSIYAKLEEKGALPALPLFVLKTSRAIRATYGAPVFVGFAMLVLADVGIARGLNRWKNARVVYAVWSCGVISCAVVALVLLVKAWLTPVFVWKM